MAKKYDVISVGSGLVDAFVYTGVKEIDSRICFPVGTKILISDIAFATGGGGTNSASCFSLLGLRTGFLGRIGSGYNSRIILRELKKKGVDFLGNRGNEHTGYSIILEGHKRHRTILTFKGASDNLKFSDIKSSRLDTKWFHYTSMEGESFEMQKRLIEFAKERGIKVSFNPSSYQTKKGAGYLSKILKNVDVLSLNREEAGMLVRGDLHKGLHALGPEIVCITNGESEGEVYDGEFLYRYRPNKIKVGECTGAGDVFSSSFVTGLMKLKNIEKAIKVAMANAESVIAERGAKQGMLSWNGIKRRMRNRRFKVKKEIA